MLYLFAVTGSKHLIQVGHDMLTGVFGLSRNAADPVAGLSLCL